MLPAAPPDSVAAMQDVLVCLGLVLFLLGLLTGLAVAATKNPRMAVASHLQGMTNGPFLIVVGLLWPKLDLSHLWQVVTVVLLGGVSIFGGVGSMVGVLLATYLVLNLRNGLVIAGVTGNTQTGIIGLLLILSVLLPNLVERARERLRRRQADAVVRSQQTPPGDTPWVTEPG